MGNPEFLIELATEISVCTLCDLHRGRTKAVPGEGPSNAEIMFIGEGPGFHEDRQGRPFVGASGKFLDELMALAGVSRPEVFIANVVKCRPPENRDPQPEEVDICTKTYLFKQIATINPAVIVTLGRFSMSLFLPGRRIMQVHGQPQKVDGRLVVPMLHPAAALHQPQNRPILEADFRRLPEFLEQVHAERAAVQADNGTQEPPIQQMSMF